MHQDAAGCSEASQGSPAREALVHGVPPCGFWVATEVEDEEEEEGEVGGSRGCHEPGTLKQRCEMRRRLAGRWRKAATEVASVRGQVMPCNRR